MEVFDEVPFNDTSGLFNGTGESAIFKSIDKSVETALEEMFYYPGYSFHRILADSFIFSCSHSFFFLLSWVFFTRLFEDYEVRAKIVRSLFSAIFSISCSMFELIIFEILDILDRNSRWWCWKIDLYGMMALLIVIIPLYMLHLLVSNHRVMRSRPSLFTIALFGVYLYVFYKIGAPFPIMSGRRHNWLALEHGLSRVEILGVSTFGVLSGLGSVYGPYKHVSYFLRRIEETEIVTLRRRLLQTLERILVRKKRLILAKSELRRVRGYNYVESPGWFSWLASGVGLGSAPSETRVLVNDIKSLTAEIEMLAHVRVELFTEINDLQRAQQKIKESRTCKGRVKNLAGYILSCYCIFKILMATFNLALNRKRKTDPITRILGILLRYSFGVQIDVQFWSLHASFTLVGVIVATQMRGFLINLVKLFRSWSSVNTSNFIIAISSEIMGMYFVSSVLLIRMNLPVEYRRILNDVFGDLAYDFYHHWNDLIFLISALLSITFLSLSRYSVTQTRYSV